MRSAVEGIAGWLLWISARAVQGRQGELSGYTASTFLDREHIPPSPSPSLKHTQASSYPQMCSPPTTIYLYHAVQMHFPMQGSMNMVLYSLFKEHYHLIRASPPRRHPHEDLMQMISAHCDWGSAGALHLWGFVPPLLACLWLRLLWLFQNVTL